MNAELSVRKTVKEHEMIRPKDRVILGLSGGPDSLCLLYVLAEMRRSLRFELSALHLNHLMRGEKASEDVEWLSARCRELGVPLTVSVCDVYRKASEEGISPEEAGRKARHGALKRQQACMQSACGSGPSGGRVLIALAHNRDDQAETVLMRILRGSGVHGIAAMEHVRSDGLIRPLLDTPRSEIERYCERLDVRPRWDSTNADLAYTRNRLRLELMPSLAREYNPNLKDCLVRLSANAREDDDCLERLARAEIKGYSGSFPVKRLAALDPAVAKRAVRMLFYEKGLVEDIASAHLNSLLAAVKARRTGKVIEFPHGFTARLTRDSVLFLAPREEGPARVPDCLY